MRAMGRSCIRAAMAQNRGPNSGLVFPLPSLSAPPFLMNPTVDPANPSTVYFLASLGPPGSALYKSTNGGQTWNQINFGTFAPPLMVASDSTVYANRSDRSLVRSTDGGVTFTATGFKSD